MIMSSRPQLFEYQTPGTLSTASKDGLFFERLETFLEKSLLDIKAFAEREQQPYEETRRHVAQWHAKYLFQPTTPVDSITELTGSERAEKIKPVLCDTSRILESLSDSWGVHSFLLAVDPYNPSDAGFLGGSLLGREFWRGLRSGGDNGARSFRIHCTTQLQVVQKDVKPFISAAQRPVRASTSNASSISAPVRSVKSELYECIRNELRSVSGRRTAEMKWSNPERLDIYGVRVVGWPKEIPAQNPSSLKTSQNRQLLEAFQAGTMRFERIGTPTSKIAESSDNPPETFEDVVDQDNAEDFSWAFDVNAV
ncbi:hypothetical protein CPB83DRAFT_844559 [Crepidotus variabilis]|uniref:Uncharacterized protein n=1 Tax=Crepidotus variabilis TaxID=179855 RepID=A0A9P6ESF5_9AGAR|nr:hypothetical protein CPB83DRAFT_844559 [Crepidotus variabilis]